LKHCVVLLVGWLSMKSAAAFAWISVVLNRGMAASSCFRRSGISVHPRITPWAPLAASFLTILTSSFLDDCFSIPTHSSL